MAQGTGSSGNKNGAGSQKPQTTAPETPKKTQDGVAELKALVDDLKIVLSQPKDEAVLEAVKELTKTISELAVEVKKNSELIQAAAKAGKF